MHCLLRPKEILPVTEGFAGLVSEQLVNAYYVGFTCRIPRDIDATSNCKGAFAVLEEFIECAGFVRVRGVRDDNLVRHLLARAQLALVRLAITLLNPAVRRTVCVGS